MSIRFLSIPVLALALLPGSALAAAHSGHSGHAAQQESAQPASARVYTTSGIVEAVHKAEGKVTVSHQPVPALNWPAMTMRFSLESSDQLEGIKPGDRVRLDFRNEGNVSLIQEIEVLP
jgi:Cu(I)/Ag(I) efflux system protein CusF